MNFTKFNKCVASLTMVLLLIVWMIPLQAFATEQSARNSKTRSVDLEVELKIEGDTPPEVATFTFIMTADDGAPLPEETSIARSGAGFTGFGEIYYTEAGEYHYKISERNDGLENYTYDDTVYSVDVNVNADRQGNLSIDVVAYDENNAKEPEIVFVNLYDEPTPGVISNDETSNPSQPQTTTEDEPFQSATSADDITTTTSTDTAQSSITATTATNQSSISTTKVETNQSTATTDKKESKVKKVVEKIKSKISPYTGNDSEVSHNYRIVIWCILFIVLLSCVWCFKVVKKRRKKDEKL